MTSEVFPIFQNIFTMLIGQPSEDYSIVPFVVAIVFVMVLVNDFCHMLGVLIRG